MEKISILYEIKLFIMESVNCFVIKMKMYFRGFNEIFRKSVQSISQNPLNFQL